MKTIKKASLLFASLALALGAGLVGNNDTKEVKAANTLDVSISERANTLNWKNAEVQSGWKDQNNIFTFTQSGDGNNGKYYSSNSSWRFYNGGKAIITSPSDYSLQSVTASLSNKTTQKWTIDSTKKEASFSFTSSIQILSISIAYEAIDSNTHEITITGDSEVEVNKTTTLVASCSKKDDITWTCEPETVATISETGEVTGIGIGDATITAKCEGTSATHKITVIRPSTTATINFSEKCKDAQKIETITIDNYIEAVFDKGSNNSTPTYYDSGKSIRVYGGNTFTISTDTTKNIASIILSFGTSGDGTNKITTDVGTFSKDTWTGSAQSVTFTIGGTSKHRRIASITVIYENTVLGDFVDDWNATIRTSEKGLCDFLSGENKATLEALIVRYKALEDANKAELTDNAGVKISNSIEYAQNVWNNVQSTEGNYGASGVVITSNNSYDKTSLIALFAILGIVTISGYYIIEKKKFSK